MTAYLILVNDHSGRGRAAVTARMLGQLIQDASIGPLLGIYACQAETEWGPFLRREKHVTCLVCGGDGSLHHLLQRIDTRHHIMPVPVGTANLMAHELGLKTHLKHLMQVLKAKHTVPIRSLQCELDGQPSHHVVHHVSFGLDAEVVRVVHEDRDGPIRQRDYLQAMVQVMRHHQPRPMRVWLGGEDHGLFEAGIITFGRCYADHRLSLPGYQRDTLAWRCILWRHGSSGSMLTRLWYGMRGVWPTQANERLDAPLTHLRWEAVDQPIAWQVDGEWLGAGQAGSLILDDAASWCYLVNQASAAA